MPEKTSPTECKTRKPSRKSQILDSQKTFFDQCLAYLEKYYSHVLDDISENLEDTSEYNTGFKLNSRIGYTIEIRLFNAEVDRKSAVIVIFKIFGGDGQEMNIIKGLESKLYKAISRDEQGDMAELFYRVQTKGVDTICINAVYEGEGLAALHTKPIAARVEIIPVDCEEDSINTAISSKVKRVPPAVFTFFCNALEFVSDKLELIDYLDQQEILSIAFKQKVQIENATSETPEKLPN